MRTPGKELPQCPNGHGQMVLRQNPTELAAWLGTWYDCAPGPPWQSCTSSVLYDSAELRAFEQDEVA